MFSLVSLPHFRPLSHFLFRSHQNWHGNVNSPSIRCEKDFYYPTRHTVKDIGATGSVCMWLCDVNMHWMKNGNVSTFSSLLLVGWLSWLVPFPAPNKIQYSRTGRMWVCVLVHMCYLFFSPSFGFPLYSFAMKNTVWKYIQDESNWDTHFRNSVLLFSSSIQFFIHCSGLDQCKIGNP